MDRRSVLLSLLASGGVASDASGTDVGGFQSINGVFDVQAFGAIGNGTTGDHAAIQKAVDSASKKGGIVLLPPGKYLLEKPLNIDAPIILQGFGWHRDDTNLGSWLYIKHEQSQVFFRSLGAQGAQMRDIGFVHDQPNGEPKNYAPAIHVKRDDVHIENVHLFNATDGILVENGDPKGAVGRVVLNHIWGRPMRNGIIVNTARDVVKINDVHFWPFWNKDDGWTRKNGVAIRFRRADNPQLSNVFVLGYDTGIMTEGSSDGVTSKLMMTNIDADDCNRAVALGGDNATAVITNLSAQGAPGVNGISTNSSGVKLQASNIRLTEYTTNAIRAQGAGSKIFLQNVWCENWNRSKQGFPAIEAAESGAEIFIGRPVYFDRGNGGPHTGGSGIRSEWNDLIAT